MSTLVLKELRVDRGGGFILKVPALRVNGRSIVCVAGPNGSGKSTLLHCIAGLLSPQSGRITIEDTDVNNNLRAIKLLIGFVPDDEEWIIKELCADEYFDLLARTYNDAGCKTDVKRHTKALSRLLSFNATSQPLGSLSHGNIKKVQLIAALMHKPKLIVLDEVRNGLDPIAILAVEQLLKEERERGACIVAATHDLWWAERLSDRTILIANGEIQINQKTSSLVEKFGSLEKLFIEKNSLKR